MNTPLENEQDVSTMTESDAQESGQSAAAETKKSGKDVDQYIKNVVETLLFVQEKPVTIDQLKGAIDTAGAVEIKKAIKALMDEYEEKDGGMTIVELAGGYQMRTNPQYASYVKEFYKTKHKDKLSKPALETLAIIAYKQPVTRADVELIRGVNSDGVVVHLINKELIKVAGRKDVPGRPFMYGTTKQFLEYFGLKSLDYLPKLEEFPSLLGDEEKEMDEDEIKQEQELSTDAEVKEHIEEESVSEIEEIEQEAEDQLDDESKKGE